MIDSLWEIFWSTSHPWAEVAMVFQWLIMLVCVILFVIQLVALLRVRAQENEVVSTFWSADNLTSAIDQLSVQPMARWHNELAYQGLAAANWRQKQEAKGLRSGLPMAEWIDRHMRLGYQKVKAQAYRGLTLLRISVPLMIMLGVFGSLSQLAYGLLSLEATQKWLGGALLPILMGLVLSIFLWLAYCVLRFLSQDVISRLDNFRVDLHDYLLVELGQANGIDKER